MKKRIRSPSFLPPKKLSFKYADVLRSTEDVLKINVEVEKHK